MRFVIRKGLDGRYRPYLVDNRSGEVLFQMPDESSFPTIGQAANFADYTAGRFRHVDYGDYEGVFRDDGKALSF